MNPWHSRIQSPDNPDWCLIDLDPDTNSFEQVIETALLVKQVLDATKIPSYCKTSGSTGMHIFIPLGAKYSYDQSRILAELIVTTVHHEIPAYTDLERSSCQTKGQKYIWIIYKTDKYKPLLLHIHFVLNLVLRYLLHYYGMK